MLFVERNPGLFPRRESLYRAYRAAKSQVTSTCLVRHLPLKCHSIEGGTRFHIRKASMSWSPLTESNRRPSPYHGPPRRSRTGHTGPDQPGAGSRSQPPAGASPREPRDAPQSAPRGHPGGQDLDRLCWQPGQQHPTTGTPPIRAHILVGRHSYHALCLPHDRTQALDLGAPRR